jgi:hypothetical protein
MLARAKTVVEDLLRLAVAIGVEERARMGEVSQCVEYCV